MANVDTHWFAKGGKNLVEAEIGWASAAINVALMGPGWVPDQANPENWIDVQAAEAVGAGYVAGGIVIPNRTVTVAGNETQLKGDPAIWPNSTITSSGAVIYVTAGAKPLLGYVTFGSDRASNAAVFQINWQATGVLRLRAL